MDPRMCSLLFDWGRDERVACFYCDWGSCHWNEDSLTEHHSRRSWDAVCYLRSGSDDFHTRFYAHMIKGLMDTLLLELNMRLLHCQKSIAFNAANSEQCISMNLASTLAPLNNRNTELPLIWKFPANTQTRISLSSTSGSNTVFAAPASTCQVHLV